MRKIDELDIWWKNTTPLPNKAKQSRGQANAIENNLIAHQCSGKNFILEASYLP